MTNGKNEINQVTPEDFEMNIKVMSFFADIDQGVKKTGKCCAHYYQLYVSPDQVRKLAKTFKLPVRGPKEHPKFSFFTQSKWNFDDSGQVIDYDVFTGLVMTDWRVGVENV